MTTTRPTLAPLEHPITSKWLVREGWRLDAAPFLSGKVEALQALEKLPTQRLAELTTGHNGGIFNGPQFSRVWVDDPGQGVPLVGSSDMLLADLSRLPLLRKKDAESRKLSYLKLQEGMILISCAGTIGRTVYCRSEMNGMWSSQHVMKIVPDVSRIPSGYLYAFLSSKYGNPLVVSGTYGSIIQGIEPEHLRDIPVPRLGSEVESEVNLLIQDSARLQSEASTDMQRSESILLEKIGVPPKRAFSKHRAVQSHEIQRINRLDAHFYHYRAIDIDKWIENNHPNHVTLGSIADVYDVPLFKHIYVERDFGLPFFTSGDIFHLHKIADKNLSKNRTKNIEKYILNHGWILLARSGQIGGIIGQPEYADTSMKGSTASDHVIRIVPNDVPAGYLFTYLNTKMIGYWLLIRTASGTSIPALFPVDLKPLKVILTDPETMSEISSITDCAFEKRATATRLELKAIARLENAIQGGR